MKVEYRLDDKLEEAEVVSLYKENSWSSAKKPKQLMDALGGSHSVVSARVDSKLVGLGNAISDGHLVVYYPHLLVRPAYWERGIGRGMMKLMQEKYAGYHQQMLTADGAAIGFYEKLGFSISRNTSLA